MEKNFLLKLTKEMKCQQFKNCLINSYENQQMGPKSLIIVSQNLLQSKKIKTDLEILPWIETNNDNISQQQIRVQSWIICKTKWEILLIDQNHFLQRQETLKQKLKISKFRSKMLTLGRLINTR